MDSSVFKKLEEHTQCSICLESYSDPRQLQCHHVFCSSCLEVLLTRSQHNSRSSSTSPPTSLACPSCRKETKLPTGSVEDIQPAFHMSSLLDITSGMDLSSLSGAQNTSPLASLSSSQPPLPAQPSLTHTPMACDSEFIPCSTHKEEPVKLFCDTCGEVICFLCAISGGDHHSHSYVALPAAFDKHRGSLESLLESLSEGQNKLSDILGKVDASEDSLKEQQTSIEKDVLEAFQELHAILNKRQIEVLDQMKASIRDKTKTLLSHRDDLEVAESKISRSVDLLRSNLSCGGVAKLLKARKGIEKQKDELSAILQRSLHYVETAKISFQPSEDVPRACREFGSIIEPSKPDPAKCFIKVSESDSPISQVGDTYSMTAFIFDSDGKPLESSVDLFCTADLIPDDDSSKSSQLVVEGVVRKVGSNQYEVSYLPSVAGTLVAHVKVLNQHIQGSPFRVSIRESGASTNVSGSWKFLEMRGILAVAVSPVDGSVVLAKSSKPCVVVLDSSGKEVRSFGQFGFGAGHLNGASGIAVNHQGEIAVADTNNNRVTLFGAEGNFVASMGSKHSKSLSLDHPRSIIFSMFNKYWYVLDSKDVYVLQSRSLSLVSSFRQKGAFLRSSLQSPQGMASSANGSIYVSDTGHNSVRVFAPNGTPLTSLRLSGLVQAPLSNPTALASSNGLLCVCGKHNDKVYVYKTNGQVISLLKEEHSSEGCIFSTPVGVAVDSSGACYVADSTGLRKIVVSK